VVLARVMAPYSTQPKSKKAQPSLFGGSFIFYLQNQVALILTFFKSSLGAVGLAVIMGAQHG